MKTIKMLKNRSIKIILVLFIGLVMINFKLVKTNLIKEPAHPNILWIMTDEQRPCSLGCYGSDWAKTPNIDLLASRGTVFTKAYPQCPQCQPSRTAQLTSRYPQEVNCTFNQRKGGGMSVPKGVKTFVDIFNDAGYQTATYGKQHTGFRINWAEQKSWVVNNDYAGMFSLNEKYNPEEYQVIGSMMIRGGIYPGGDNNPSRNITDWAIRFLKDRDQEKPFLLRVSHNYPHTPVLPSEPWDTLYNPEDIPIRYVDTAVAHARSKWDQMSSSRHKMDQMSIDDYDQSWQHYMGLCAQVDDEVGRLIKTLNDLGLSENTIIIYSSDHGACLGEFGQVTKRTFDDCSWRVPFIWSWPGHIPEGQVNNELAELISTGRSLLNLCSLDKMIPKSWRGRDLFSDPSPDAVFGQIGYPNINSVVGEKFYTGARIDYGEMRVGIRTDQYRMDYSFMKEGQKLPLADGNLFDLVNDPRELHNLWDDGKFRKIKKSLARKIDTWFDNIDKPTDLFESTNQ